jgi:formylglycine-generating enzyme required for sulfatase activity
MVLIPQGSFDMGSLEGQGRVDERPLHKVTLKSFWIGKHEISVREYCEFLNKEGAITKEGLPRINLENPDCPVIKVGKKRFRPKPDHETKPITHVSWHGAVDYAAWAGGRLPTSAEWEKAAIMAGGPRPSDSNVVPVQEGSEPTDKEDPAGGQITGMAGNVWEWCSDWYAKDYYAASPASDPLGPSLGEEKVIRGGSWASTEAGRRPKNRHGAPPLGCYRTVGFRIVKD